MRGEIGDKILAAVDKAGFVGLALMEGGSRSVYAKKPIRTMADMKGLKNRSSHRTQAAVAQAMGGNPTPIPMAEVYTALKTNLALMLPRTTPCRTKRPNTTKRRRSITRPSM